MNRSPNRGHWPPGKSRNPAPPATLRLVADFAEFIAAHKLPTGLPNPYSVKACSKDTGISSGSLKHYIAGRYIPAPEIADRLRAWLKHAKSAARKSVH